MIADDFRKTEGFSLIELMIVVAVIAILATIAINNFYAFSRRSKTSEVFTNLGTIRTGQEAYRAEYGLYVAAGAWPAATPPASGMLWETVAVPEATGFKSIAFSVDGVVRYSYQVAVAVATPYYYTATANGDLDANGIDAVYIVSNDPNEVRVNAVGRTPASIYPKPILDDASDDY